MPQDLVDEYRGKKSGHVNNDQRTTGLRVWETKKHEGMSNQMMNTLSGTVAMNREMAFCRKKPKG